MKKLMKEDPTDLTAVYMTEQTKFNIYFGDI